MALNPAVVTVSVGVREIREVKIYPLSMADQKKAKDAIFQVMDIFLDAKTSEVVLASKAIDAIADNLDMLLGLATDPDDKVTIADITNDQFADIAEAIYTSSFEQAIKKFTGLVDRIKAAAGKVVPGLTTPQETAEIPEKTT